jgi:hypothetical protein
LVSYLGHLQYDDGGGWFSQGVSFGVQEMAGLPTSSGPPTWRNNPFTRNSPSPSPSAMSGSARPKSAIYSSSLSPASPPQTAGGHARGQSFSTLNPASTVSRGFSGRPRADSKTTPAAGTFAPDFIKQEEKQKAADQIKSIEGDNDFSGKRYVWVKDHAAAFVKGWVVEDTENGQLLVQCDDGSVSISAPRCEPFFGVLTSIYHSNARLMPIMWTKSTLPSSIRRMTWRN